MEPKHKVFFTSGNELSALAFVDDDNKVHVHYNYPFNQESVTTYTEASDRLVSAVLCKVTAWAIDNNYTMWSY